MNYSYSISISKFEGSIQRSSVSRHLYFLSLWIYIFFDQSCIFSRFVFQCSSEATHVPDWLEVVHLFLHYALLRSLNTWSKPQTPDLPAILI